MRIKYILLIDRQTNKTSANCHYLKKLQNYIENYKYYSILVLYNIVNYGML